MSNTPASPIVTKRLDLVPATAAMIRAEMSDCAELGRLLGARVPADWPLTDLADALPFYLDRIEACPADARWLMYYWVLRPASVGEGRRLVGSGGFKGGPDADGVVEVGYGVAPEFRRRGLASEGLAGLCASALGDERVRRIIADTRYDNAASRAVLEKNGFVAAGDGAEPETMRYHLS